MRLTRRRFGMLSLSAALAPAVARAQRLPSVREVPWLGEIQTPPSPLPADVPPLRSLLMDARGNKLASLEQWKQQRAQLREAWLNLLGVWPSPRRPPEYEILESMRTATISRQLIRYDSEWGVKCEAYLLRPSPARQQMPGVVVFHSTVDYTIRQGAGLEGPPQAAWGLKLAERGFVVLCPRCFLWNDGRDVDYMVRVNEHRRRHPQSPGMAQNAVRRNAGRGSAGEPAGRRSATHSARPAIRWARKKRSTWPHLTSGSRPPSAAKAASAGRFPIGRPLVSGHQELRPRASRIAGTGRASGLSC